MGDPIPSGAGAIAPAPCTGPIQIWAVEGRACGGRPPWLANCEASSIQAQSRA